MQKLAAHKAFTLNREHATRKKRMTAKFCIYGTVVMSGYVIGATLLQRGG
jgi:hypothetical protein